MNKRISFIFLCSSIVISLALLNGCSTYQTVTAYFNTYYNARKAFDDAVLDLSKTPRPDRDTNYFAPMNAGGVSAKFDKVVEKCSKLIQYYPQSTLVDDAIMLIGKSCVYLNETETATRKFSELLTNYPESNLRFEAKLWNAKALYYSLREEEAIKAVDELFPEAQEAGEDNIALEAEMLVAQIYFKKGEYDEVIKRLEKTKVLSGDGLLSAIAQYQLATCYDRLDEFEKAADAYQNVLDASPDFNLQFRARLHRGIMLAYANKTSEALEEFENLNSDELKSEEQALVDHEVANVYAITGDTARAFGLYRYVDTTYKRTEAASKSYFRQGLIYEEEMGDFKHAKEFYDKAKTESQTADVVPFAKKRSDYLTKYFAIQANIHKYDSLFLKLLHDDSLDVAKRHSDSLKAADSTKKFAGNIDSTKSDSTNKILTEGEPPGERSGGDSLHMEGEMNEGKILEERPIKNVALKEGENVPGDSSIIINNAEEISSAEHVKKDSIPSVIKEGNKQEGEPPVPAIVEEGKTNPKIIASEESPNKIDSTKPESNPEVSTLISENRNGKIIPPGEKINENGSQEMQSGENLDSIADNESANEDSSDESVNEPDENADSEVNNEEVDSTDNEAGKKQGEESPGIKKAVEGEIPVPPSVSGKDLIQKENLQNLDGGKNPRAVNKPALNDSIKPKAKAPPPVVQPAELTFDSIDVARSQNYYELASLFLLEMNLPDSALFMYQKVVNDYPMTPIVPKVLYALAEIYRTDRDSCAVDSLYHIIANNYPLTEYGKYANKYFGVIEDTTKKVDSSAIRYSQISIITDSTEAPANIEKLQQLIMDFPNSQYAAKAQYAIGWIYENILFYNDSAASAYKTLMELYPASSYVESARPKVAVKENPSSLNQFVKVKPIDLVAKQEKKRPGANQPGEDDERHRSPFDRLKDRNDEDENSDQQDDELTNPSDEDNQDEAEPDPEPEDTDPDGDGGGKLL